VQDVSGFVISTGANVQDSPAVGWDGTNFLVVWRDFRAGNIDLFGTRMTGAGAVLDTAGIAISTAAATQNAPAVSWNGANYLVVWEDLRSGNKDIYGARISPAGAVQDPAGIVISAIAGDQLAPAVASDGTNSFVVWQDGRDGGSNKDVYGARVTAAGTAQDDGGMIISALANSQGMPAIAWGGSTYFVAWEDGRAGSGTDLYGARVSAAGTVVDPNGIAISLAANEQLTPAVASDGTNFFVVWRDTRLNASVGDIYGARVSAAGAVQDSAGMVVSAAQNDQSQPALAWDGTDYLAVWADLRGATADIYGARVALTGTVLDATGIALSTAASSEQFPAVITRANREALVGWQAFDPSALVVRVLGRMVTFDTAPLANAQAVTINEDTPGGLTLTGSDPDSDPLTFTVLSLPAHGTLTGTGPNRSYAPAADYNGPDSFTFKTNDGTLDSAPATVSVTVNSVNDAPTFAALGDLVMIEDGAAPSVAVIGLAPGGGPDEASQTLTVSATSNHPELVPDPRGTPSGAGWTLSVAPLLNAAGVVTITVTALDSGGATSSQSFALDITPVNDAPVFDRIPPQQTGAGFDTYLVAVANIGPGGGVDEAANQVVALSASSSDPGIVPDPAISGGGAIRTLNLLPASPTARGSVTITVVARDSGGTTLGGVDTFSWQFRFDITDINQSPQAQNADVVTVAGVPVAITLQGIDADLDPLTFEVLSPPDQGTLTGMVPNLTYTPAEGFSGEDRFTFRASDGPHVSVPATVTITVVPRGADGTRRAYYGWQWGQGCGCSGEGGGPLGLMAFLLLALCSRRRRVPRRLVGAWLVALVALAAPGLARAEESVAVKAPAPAGKKLKLAFMGVSASIGVPPEAAKSVSSFVKTQLAGLDAYEVISSDDIVAMLGMERQRQLLGCTEDSEGCMAEIAGALNSDRALSGELSSVGDTTLLNFTLLDLKASRPISRVSRRVDGAGAVDRILDQVGPAIFELVSADPALSGRKLKYERPFGGFAVGVRGEVEFVGRSAAPTVMAEFSGKWLGAVVAVVIGPTPGFRAEGRFYPFTLGRVRSYLGLGGTLFFPAVGLRGAVGAEVRIGQLHLFADAAYERFVNSDASHNPNAVILSLGAGWLF
jgi:MYXO-CTERM domain-containing protein